MRITCEILARVFSSHIAGAAEEDKRASAAAFRDVCNRVEKRLRKDRDVAGTLAGEGEGIAKALREIVLAGSLGLSPSASLGDGRRVHAVQRVGHGVS